MAAETIFDFVSERLEQATDFDRLEARGTVRLALKQAGLEPKTLSGVREMQVVLQQILPRELESRGIPRAEAVCARLAEALERFAPADSGGVSGASPEAIFKRIGGG